MMSYSGVKTHMALLAVPRLDGKRYMRLKMIISAMGSNSNWIIFFLLTFSDRTSLLTVPIALQTSLFLPFWTSSIAPVVILLWISPTPATTALPSLVPACCTALRSVLVSTLLDCSLAIGNVYMLFVSWYLFFYHLLDIQTCQSKGKKILLSLGKWRIRWYASKF